MPRAALFFRLCRHALWAALGAGLGASPAHAAPEEIQVYTNDINQPGQLGLELHVNQVPLGDAAPAYPGAEASASRLRVTPEWSYALNDHFELGAYLPLATLDQHGALRVEGYKLRLKWLGRHADTGLYYGLNYEVGRESYRLDQNPWNNEIKLIAGWQDKRWLVGGNVNVDFALSGPAKTPPDIELDARLGYKLSAATMIGIESYNGAGSTRNLLHFSAADQSTFAALDTRLGRWDLNLGVGKGYGTNADSLIVKMIIGVPIGR